MTDKIADLVGSAALEMANAHGVAYDDCKGLVLAFLQIEDQATLYHLELVDEATAKSKALRNVFMTSKDLDSMDLLQGLTAVAGFAIAGEPIGLVLNIVNAGLFFIRTYTKATTVKLDPSDASVLWALYRLGGRADRDVLLPEWRKVIAESSVDATTTAQKLSNRLESLAALGCVAVDAREARIIQEVRRG